MRALSAEIAAAYKGRSVLITGGLGFIGSNLARCLVHLGARCVSLLDAFCADQGANYHNLSGISGGLRIVRGNMGEKATTLPLVEAADFIFNLAAQGSHVRSMRDSHLDLEMNCSAHLSFLEVCRDVNPSVPVVYTSTRQVYGRPEYLPVDEGHPIAPPDLNGIHKYTGEQYHLLFHRLYGIRSVCLRLTNTFGPRQSLRGEGQGVLGVFLRQALDGDDLVLFEPGTAQRDLNYVDDVVEALLISAATDRAYGEVFNLGAEVRVSLVDIAEELIRRTSRGRIRFAPFPRERRLIDIGDMFCDTRKIQRVLGWQPQTPWKEGLARTVAFFLENRDYY